MSKTDYTFWELLRDENINNGIEIPMIQRDYAQGRNNSKVNTIREEFLDDLRTKTQKLKVGELTSAIELDFIYGSIDNHKFIPLDGQQRLTTLFLLHWYLCLRDRQLDNYGNILSKFSYQTRTTSKDFCRELTEPKRQEDFWDILFSEDSTTTPRKLIMNQPWFFLDWVHDPTVESMLNMLDDIHAFFRTSELTWDDLTNSDKRFISFHYLPINTYGLSDGLYVKMNARGKVLTDFENFKAKFENFLREQHEEHVLNFTSNIDGRWCDLFWSFIKSDEQIEEFDRFDLVDAPLLNFIFYITEMLFYREQLNEEKEFDISLSTIKKVYSEEENLKFLFDAFEVFIRIGKDDFKTNIQSFFSALFSEQYSPERVSLFEGGLNLFERCLFRKSRFDIKEKSLLYGLIFYLIQSKDDDVSVNLKDYMRLCRNYILSINQKIKDSFTPELRKEYYYSIIDTFEKIFDAQDVYGALGPKQADISFKTETIEHELNKARLFSLSEDAKSLVHKLEDNSNLQGALNNIIPYSLDGFDLNKRVDDYEQVWGLENDSLIARALLSTGDYSEKIASSNFGEVRFFGKGNKWSRLLMSRNGVIHTVLQVFFRNLSMIQGASIEERLNKLIDLNHNNRQFESWEKLFIDHSSILSSKKNIFVFNWNGRNDYRVELLTGTTLGAYHINAYAFAVIREIDNPTWIDSDKSYAKHSDRSCLQLTNGIKLSAQSEFWSIENLSQELYESSKEIVDLRINENEQFELWPSDEVDFVNVAKRFVEKIFE